MEEIIFEERYIFALKRISMRREIFFYILRNISLRRGAFYALRKKLMRRLNLYTEEYINKKVIAIH